MCDIVYYTKTNNMCKMYMLYNMYYIKLYRRCLIHDPSIYLLPNTRPNIWTFYKFCRGCFYICICYYVISNWNLYPLFVYIDRFQRRVSVLMLDNMSALRQQLHFFVKNFHFLKLRLKQLQMIFIDAITFNFIFC